MVFIILIFPLGQPKECWKDHIFDFSDEKEEKSVFESCPYTF